MKTLLRGAKHFLATLRARIRARDPSGGLDPDFVVQLLFGGGRPDHDELVRAVAGSGPITGRPEIRRLLASMERQFTPSPVTIRFEPHDVVLVDATDFKVLVDVADPSVGGLIASSREWEPHTSAVMRTAIKPGMTVVDVGANIGWFSLLAASLLGPQGRVIAVEPWSENCRLLLLSIMENGFDNIELWPIALDRHRGWAHFMTHVGSNGGLISDSADALASGNGQIVPVFPLDELLGADEKVDFLKIDVEGAESRVLLGAQKTLERCRPIVMSEFSIDMLTRVSGVDPETYLRWFTDRRWNLNVIDRTDGGLRSFAGPRELLDWWPDRLHIEDLLFLPHE